jgi:hypothetical protein
VIKCCILNNGSETPLWGSFLNDETVCSLVMPRPVSA